MAGMICSFSPQISDSNADPAAAKWQVTFHGRPANVIVSPMPVLGKAADQPLADAHLVLAGRGLGALGDVRRWRAPATPASLTPRTTTLASLVVSPSRPSGMTTYTSGLTSGAPVGPARDVGRAR